MALRSIVLLLPAVVLLMATTAQAQSSGTNFFWCWGRSDNLTQERCCGAYYPSEDGLYTGTPCTAAWTSEDSSILYCANGNPVDPIIPGAVLPACCASHSNSTPGTSFKCSPKPISS
ncbi:uncharacterized protein BCR38DRAFT_422769 [Pseudomassariella vexata]|uniref:Uncharacterized protein n=1 Tax=Pseudomassariella vexata TaxID=1141098 RepID=A0A1Y2E9S3_9PEZI|nr:uncharacterized protein BCR38DRAFT_422769 [Pseudomassariella vexata]ORY68330.1 hypothetical protein BCR38DRAFT_422769 [Pseudomassariella vexata]